MTTDFYLESDAFKNGEQIPEDYTMHGKNLSPPLRWDNVPKSTKELALICEDPDAPKNPPFIHWVLYKIPVSQKELKEGIGSEGNLAAKVGKNSTEKTTYMGPEPPPGSGIHRYYFRLFALDQKLDLQDGLTKDELFDAIRNHIISEAEIMGKHSYH